MTRHLMALVALASLAACAAGPKPAPIKEVATIDQGEYWLIDQDSLPQDLPSQDACFRVKAVIADGKLVDPKILAVIGPGIEAWLPGFLAKLRFYPAPTNPTSMPISTVLTWNLTKSVTTKTTNGQQAEAAIKALAEEQPADAKEWGRKCQAEMDQQLGITPAPAAVTATHPH